MSTVSVEKSKNTAAQLTIQSLSLSRSTLVMNSHPHFLLDNGQEILLYKNTAVVESNEAVVEYHPELESDAHLIQQLIYRLNRSPYGALCHTSAINSGSELAYKFNQHLIEDQSRTSAIYLQKPMSLVEYVDTIKKNVLEKLKTVM